MIGQKNIIVNMGKLSNIYISIFTKKIYMCIKYVLQIYVWKIFVYLVFSQEYFHWVLDKSTKYTLRTYNRYGKFKEHIPHPHWPQLGGGGGYNIPGAAQEVRFNMKLDFIQYFQISRNIFWLPYSFTPYILWKVTQYISSSTTKSEGKMYFNLLH